MIQNLYLILVVVARALGLYTIGSGVLGFVASAFITRGFVSVTAMLFPVLTGAVLWYVAKPAAAFITRDLP